MNDQSKPPKLTKKKPKKGLTAETVAGDYLIFQDIVLFVEKNIKNTIKVTFKLLGGIFKTIEHNDYIEGLD